jgi:hypothetical protein
MNERLEYLFNRYYDETYTSEEKTELLNLIDESETDPVLKSLIDKAILKTTSEMKLDKDASEAILQSIFIVDNGERLPYNGMKKPAVVRSIKSSGRKFLIRIAAAAIVILFISGYFLYFNKNGTKTDVVATLPVKEVEAPKSTKAIITLANGQKIYMDSLNEGTLATQGNIKVVKTADGQIVYNGASTEMMFNTLYNPRGSKVINLTLNDGTKVWLNSESSLKYPMAFAGNERRVEITGEAYFEVMHDATKPFYVSKGATAVEVLGTHFNVNAYEEEADIKITLLEGSVKVSQASVNGSESLTIKPGQQARVSASETSPQNKNGVGHLSMVAGVDVDDVMAWKNGLFSFRNSDIKTVMQQLARWYNIEVEYQGAVPSQHFSGKIGRELNLSDVLNGLQLTKVHFKMEGRKIVILP